MSGVSPGSPVSAGNSNSAWLSKNGDDATVGKVDLNNADVPNSGDPVTNIQAQINGLNSYTGKNDSSPTALPEWSAADVGTLSDDLFDRSDATSLKFNETTGHMHTGNPGDAPQIASSNLSNVPLHGYFISATDISSVTGSSVDVSSLMVGQTASLGDDFKGVVVINPMNMVPLKDANFDDIKNSTGDTVYGRLTKSGSVWTLSFFYLNGSVETAQSLTSQYVKWWYQKLFSPIVDAPIYSELLIVPSDNATADVIDATSSLRGLVSASAQTLGGKKTLNDGSIIKTSLQFEEQVDSTTTGSGQSLTVSKPIIKVTNGSLASVNNIASPLASQVFILINGIGASLTITNDSGGTAANRILTGTGADLSMADGSSLLIAYDDNSTRFRVIGGSGSGSSVSLIRDLKNYLSANPSAEVNTSGWATYADAAGSRPVDGTGGSPTVTWTRSTSSPLAGSGMFVFTKDAANRQGEGVSYDFTIDRLDQGKVLAIELDLSLGSGTFSGSITPGTDSDIIIDVYDKTNAVLIEPAGILLEPMVTGQFYRKKCTFQTSINSTSYRVIFHVATTSASAYTINIDDVRVGPQSVSNGLAGKDEELYTPSFGAAFGTATNKSAYWSRIGDCLFVRGSATTGTGAAAAGSISLPAGLSIDTAKLSISGNSLGSAGNIIGVWGGTTSAAGNISVAPGSSTTLVYCVPNFTGTNGNSPTSGTGLFANTDPISFWFKVPIAGWSSNVQMSNDADTRVIAASYYVSSNTATTADTQTNFDTKIIDTHAAVTTGASWKFTAPVSGIYKVSAVYRGNQQFALYIAKNSSAFVAFSDTQGSGTTGSGEGMVQLNAGDTVDLRPNVTTTVTGGNNSSGAHFSHVSILRLSGPSQIAASEKVYAIYGLASDTSFSSDTVIKYDTKVKDSHAAFSTSTGLFTAPMSGPYQVNVSLEISSGITNMYIKVAGTNTVYVQGEFTSGNIEAGGQIVWANAGDTIGIYTSNTKTFGGTGVGNGAYANYLSIARIG